MPYLLLPLLWYDSQGRKAENRKTMGGMQKDKRSGSEAQQEVNKREKKLPVNNKKDKNLGTMAKNGHTWSLCVQTWYQ